MSFIRCLQVTRESVLFKYASAEYDFIQYATKYGFFPEPFTRVIEKAQAMVDHRYVILNQKSPGRDSVPIQLLCSNNEIAFSPEFSDENIAIQRVMKYHILCAGYLIRELQQIKNKGPIYTL
jgi:hypothetical protein